LSAGGGTESTRKETMKKQAGTYTVQVNPPHNLATAPNWNYRPGFFPRKFHYVVEAEECAKQAIRNGATMARIEGPNGIELDFKPQQPKPCKPGAAIWKSKQGQTVWVVHCYEKRDGTILAAVREKAFDKVDPNWCGTGQSRFVLVTPGKPFGQGYGMAYKPAGVFRDRDQAVARLRDKIAERVNAWRAALDAAW
jgi:hypothetical protein